MASYVKIFLRSLLLFSTLSSCALCGTLTKKTLLISMDGFRWDYISKTATPNFDRLIQEGSHVKQVTNAFATLTMPNHWTLVTGMYEEDHGIIANSFYDKILNDTYRFSRESKWYNNTEPIWITAEKEGLKTGSFMWVGNQAEYEGLTATKVTPFASGTEFEDGVDDVIDWLTNDNIDLDFACLYTDQPDKDGHKYGPDSDEVSLRVRRIDAVLGKVMKKLEHLNMDDKVNILIASDHGMTNVSSEKMINLGAYVDFDVNIEIKKSYTSAIGLITPKAGKLEEVYTKLKAAEASEPHMKVYKKEDVPEDLKYKNNSRIPEIVIVADNGWLLKRSASYNTNLKGNHGFDNKHSDMKTTFIARGPDFKCNHKQDEMKSVDLYPLLCQLLKLNNCHQGRGTLATTEGLLIEESCLPHNNGTTTSNYRTAPRNSTTPSSASRIASTIPIVFILAFVPYIV